MTDRETRAKAARYHHGDLRNALLRATEALLAEAAAASYGLLRSHVAAVAAFVPGADEALEELIGAAAWSLARGLAMLMVDGAIAPPGDVDLDDLVDDVLRRGVAGMAGMGRP